VQVGANARAVGASSLMMVRYIDWGLQNQYDKDGQEILPRPRGGDEDEERLAAWREGRTGFP
jgi:cryptochrome